MTIKSDAFTIGTAAASAGVAGLVVTNPKVAAKASAVADAVVKNAKSAVNKDTYVKAGKTIKGAFAKESLKAAGNKIKEGMKKPFEGATYANIKDSFKKHISKESLAAFGKKFEDLGKKFAGVVKASKWKTAGAIAVVAGVVATGVVLAKNVLKKVDE